MEDARSAPAAAPKFADQSANAAKAARIPGEQTAFALEETQWDEFVVLLDAPLASTERFDALKMRPSPFAEEAAPPAPAG